MNYKETDKKLNCISEEYYLLSYDTPDFNSNSKLSTIFDDIFHTKDIFPTKFSNDLEKWHRDDYGGDCYIEGRVVNLILEENSNYFTSLEIALVVCGIVCMEENIKKLAIPINAFSIDEESFIELLTDIFQNSDLEILIYKL